MIESHYKLIERLTDQSITHAAGKSKILLIVEHCPEKSLFVLFKIIKIIENVLGSNAFRAEPTA